MSSVRRPVVLVVVAWIRQQAGLLVSVRLLVALLAAAGLAAWRAAVGLLACLAEAVVEVLGLATVRLAAAGLGSGLALAEDLLALAVELQLGRAGWQAAEPVLEVSLSASPRALSLLSSSAPGFWLLRVAPTGPPCSKSLYFGVGRYGSVIASSPGTVSA